MRTLIFLAAFAFAVGVTADEKKASPFGKSKPAAEVKAETKEPAAAATPTPKTPAKKAESPKTVEAPKTVETPKKSAPTDKAATDVKPVEKTEATSGVDTSVGDTIECKSGTDVRKLIIVDKDAGCEVEYTKFGESKVIGGAQYERDICTNVVAKVRATLETSGFSCN
jgi:hypothetical protein